MACGIISSTSLALCTACSAGQRPYGPLIYSLRSVLLDRDSPKLKPSATPRSPPALLSLSPSLAWSLPSSSEHCKSCSSPKIPTSTHSFCSPCSQRRPLATSPLMALRKDARFSPHRVPRQLQPPLRSQRAWTSASTTLSSRAVARACECPLFSIFTVFMMWKLTRPTPDHQLPDNLLLHQPTPGRIRVAVRPAGLPLRRTKREDALHGDVRQLLL